MLVFNLNNFTTHALTRGLVLGDVRINHSEVGDSVVKRVV